VNRQSFLLRRSNDPEVDLGEADQPVAGFGFGNADGFADQRLAEEDHVAAPPDLAFAGGVSSANRWLDSPFSVLAQIPLLFG
jgi:hypothetical protein